MGASGTTRVGMTGGSLAMAVDAVRVATWAMNGAGSHRNAEFKSGHRAVFNKIGNNRNTSAVGTPFDA